RGPFGPCPRSNVTAWPSRRSSKRVPVHAELWKKYSFPSSARMNPKPLSLTSRLIVPFIDAILSPQDRATGKTRKSSGAVRRVPQNGRSALRTLAGEVGSARQVYTANAILTPEKDVRVAIL